MGSVPAGIVAFQKQDARGEMCCMANRNVMAGDVGHNTLAAEKRVSSDSIAARDERQSEVNMAVIWRHAIDERIAVIEMLQKIGLQQQRKNRHMQLLKVLQLRGSLQPLRDL